MSINLSRYFKGESKKPVTKAATALDRPTFKGFRQILKSDSSMLTDRAVRGAATNSAFATRLQGTKLW